MTGIASSPDLKSHIRADWKQAHNIWKNVVLSGFVEVALIPSGGGGTIILKSDGKTLQWTKIGRQITVTGNIWVDDVLEGPTGHLDITGLPGPVGEGYSYYSAVSLYGRNLEWGTDVVVLQGYVYNDGGQTKIRVSRLHQGEEHELFAHEIIAGSQLRISATYFLEGVSSDTFGFTGIASGVAHDLLSPRHGDTVPGAVVKGALPYGNATPKWAALAPNATATKKYLSMTSSVPTWEELAAGDIPAHQLDGAKHTVSGLTPGHFLKALTATTFGFAAHGLTYSDVGAAAAGHDHSGVYEPVISAGSSAQYYRGDKTWQTLNQAAIPELTTASGPSFAHLHLADLAAIYTAAESWIGPSATAGIYFKNNNIGMGNDLPVAKLDIQKLAAYTLTYFTTYANTWYQHSLFAFRKSRQDTVGNAVTLDGDQLGSINFEGNTGSKFDSGAYIEGKQSGAASTYIPTDINFYNSTESLVNQLRMRIRSAGGVDLYSPSVVIASANKTTVSTLRLSATDINDDSAIGGTILFEGNEDTAGTELEFAGIEGKKAASNDASGYLAFYTRLLGVGLKEGFRIDEYKNICHGLTTLGTAAANNYGQSIGTAPTTSPADMSHLWVEDIAGAADKAGFHIRPECVPAGAGKHIVVGCLIKADTGDPAYNHEAMVCINTFNKTLKFYGDGGWRSIATW